MGFLKKIFGNDGNNKKSNNKQKEDNLNLQDVDSILKHIHGDPIDFTRSSHDSMKIIDNLVAEYNQPLLAEFAIKERNKEHAGYVTSQITDEKLLIDIAKNAFSRDARTTAIRKIRENPNNEEALIYIAKNDDWQFNRMVAINGINDISALNELLNDADISEDVRKRIEKLEG